MSISKTLHSIFLNNDTIFHIIELTSFRMDILFLIFCNSSASKVLFSYSQSYTNWLALPLVSLWGIYAKKFFIAPKYSMVKSLAWVCFTVINGKKVFIKGFFIYRWHINYILIMNNYLAKANLFMLRKNR